MSYKSFNPEKTNTLDENMFFGSPVNIARYDVQKHSRFEKLIEKHLSFFWRPEEVNISKDIRDWNALSDSAKHIFLSNLKRQILLDSIQGRSPNMAFLPIVSIPELETWVETWAFFETIHSRSYTYIIKNIISDPTVIFDSIMDNEHIINSAKDITKHYDDFIEYSSYYTSFGLGKHQFKLASGEVKDVNIDLYELKKKLYLTLASINILEGVRFYVSFACSWAFAENDIMEGNAKIIKLICRDENLHLASTQYMLNELPKEDSDFSKIRKECEPEIIQMYKDAVEDEKEWAEYLFKQDSMIGLNKNLLCQFVEYIANQRLTAIKIDKQFEQEENPLPWVDSWISDQDGKNKTQVAPQESEITSYLVGQVTQDADEEAFKDFKI
jgi:ribonucleoside-diphosphate reductase beta chain